MRIEGHHSPLKVKGRAIDMVDQNRVQKRKKKEGRRKSRGQSLVEFTVLLPLLLIMLSGLIEFGFLLNSYLDLIDAAREAARFAADDDPLIREGVDEGNTDEDFYTLARDMAIASIDVGSGGQIQLDYGVDDIRISAFGVQAGFVVQRYPVEFGEEGWSSFPHKVSKFTSTDINALLDPLAPATGMVLVEIFYDYHMVLGLPWITAFTSDTISLHAYSIMPNANIEPDT
jgi:hypothetical protein